MTIILLPRYKGSIYNKMKINTQLMKKQSNKNAKVEDIEIIVLNFYLHWLPLNEL